MQFCNVLNKLLRTHNAYREGWSWESESGPSHWGEVFHARYKHGRLSYTELLFILKFIILYLDSFVLPLEFKALENEDINLFLYYQCS